MPAPLFCSHSLWSAYFVPFSTVYVFRPSGNPCSNFLSSYFYCPTVWNLILLAVDTTQSEKKFSL